MSKKQTPVEIMNELITFLPEKDVKYAQKFIANREFENLYDLVLSDIRIIEKNLQKIDESQKYNDINLIKLQELFNTINEYLILLDPNWLINQSNEYEENIEEENEEWTEENYCLILVGKSVKKLIEKIQH